ncbi:MAG: DUF4349 domain-containing protein [Bacteroidetes bacterium]|nr:DUF4349 domain-containing protein [Bacteroidota bacterium]
MRFKVSTVPMALLLFLCLACNRHAEEAYYKDVAASSADSTAVSADEFNKSPQTPGQKKPQVIPAPAPNPDWDKKIIKTADLTLETRSFKTYQNRLRQTVKQSGGYISQEQQTQSAASIDNTVTIKVPVERFDDLLQQLPADSDKVVEKKISSEDVTAQFIDTRSRLETKKQAHARYLELLHQAKNMKDILDVQEAIDGLQEEMDAASGQVAYLSHSAAFSTINLHFYEVLDKTAYEPPSFGQKLVSSLVRGWGYLGEAIVQLTSVWPFILLGGLTLFFVSRYKRKAPAKTGATSNKE